MARSALKFDDATYAALLGAARDADAAHPHNNPAFLDAFLANAWKAAHRIYGAQTYLRFMAQSGVTRRPSAGTVQKAIVRARALFETPAIPAFGAMSGVGGAVWAQQLEQNLARAMTLLDAMPESHHALGDGADVADAMQRVHQLERENLELRARLAQMTVAAAYAREALGETLTGFTPHAMSQANNVGRHGV
ncbi:hypothetical protein PCA20602_00830 [Pandoraea capi]|uniref:Uncharacterized protein n=1 Tax=Pandoraea capi TaxID=2508286 RepID=A0ABY6VQA5_9BURK|nr:hypothetical protein [Pandoraea capi]VVD75510.1 hypothetical protein PCA20602_00830 [Pandoraea capi]